MKESFRDKLGLNAANKARLEIINKIIEEYRRAGYQLTLRQLYYQLVSRDVIPNNSKEYDKLGDLLVKGRMAGVVDWEAIVDRVRVPKIPAAWKDGAEILDVVARQYRCDRMNDQDVYIEVWVEKDALSEVLKRVTDKWHVHLMVNRGYSSCTAMHDAYERFQEAESEGKELHILYIGDHDPSGLDMIRDIHDRLAEFGVEVEVSPLALTMAQIRQYNPPPNPAKMTDSRSGEYVANHGAQSWEVDALRPEVLHRLVEKGITDLIDLDLWNEKINFEEGEKARLEAVAKTWHDKPKGGK